jgi:colicin import membrane protein
MIPRKVKQIFLKPTPLLLSMIVHSGAVLLMITISASDPDLVEPVPIQAEIVTAVAIDKVALEREMDGIRSAEAQKEKVLQQKLDLAVRKRNEAIQKRKDEEKRLQEIKKRKKELELATKKAVSDKAKADERAAIAEKKAQREKNLAIQAERARKEAEKKKIEVDAASKIAQAEAQRVADESELDSIRRAIKIRVMRSFNILPNFERLSCILAIRLLPDGNVASVAVIQSSGNEIFDRHAKNAVQKAAPLPVPESKRLFRKMRSISFVFDPML